MQPTQSKLVPSRDIITGGFTKNVDLISYVVAGLLLGLALDWVLNTRPLMIIVWSLAGVGVGFYKLWLASADLEEEGKARSHGA